MFLSVLRSRGTNKQHGCTSGGHVWSNGHFAYRLSSSARLYIDIESNRPAHSSPGLTRNWLIIISVVDISATGTARAPPHILVGSSRCTKQPVALCAIAELPNCQPLVTCTILASKECCHFLCHHRQTASIITWLTDEPKRRTMTIFFRLGLHTSMIHLVVFVTKSFHRPTGHW